MEKLESLCTVGGNVKWYRHCGKRYGGSLKNGTELLCDPAILHLDIYPQKVKAGTQTDIYTSMLIATLFMIVKIWKQPKCMNR